MVAPVRPPLPRASMSSRGGGPRSAGTDGSDHAFRQTVDTKYKKAAVARRNLVKTLRMLFAYYPLACAFAVGPALATGVELDVHTAPFAALALVGLACACLLYTSPSPRDRTRSRMPSSA